MKNSEAKDFNKSAEKAHSPTPNLEEVSNSKSLNSNGKMEEPLDNALWWLRTSR